MSKRKADLPNSQQVEKRKREPTFTASEKQTLISLVEQHFDVVESKKTDAVCMRQKADEWRKIATTFNATSSVHPREWNVLKSCWENMKKRAKQEITQRNQSFMATGGGPPKKNNEDPAIERVLNLIQSRVSGFTNIFDSDGTNIASATIEPIAGTSESVIVLSGDFGNDLQESTVISDWAQYTPSMLRDTIHPALRPPSPYQVDEDQDAGQEVQQPPSPSLSAFTETAANPVATPRFQHQLSTSRRSTSRRRPTLRRATEAENLSTQRIAILSIANAHAAEEHVIKMNILSLQEEKEKELLKQERLKTRQEELKLEILELQLRK